MLYVIARKLNNGSVQIYKPDSAPLKPAKLWLTIDKYNSSKPDYRHKYITLNCYRYPIMWDKSNKDKPIMKNKPKPKAPIFKVVEKKNHLAVHAYCSCIE